MFLRDFASLGSYAILVAALGAAGCGDGDGGPRVSVTAMTYNIYLGSDLTRLATATAEQIPAAAAQIYANVVASDFPERAKVLAALIAAAAPDLVGLQEVSLYRRQADGDFLKGVVAPNAEEPVLDFLAVLMAELDARSAGYRVVNEAFNADAELPVADGSGAFFDLRLTDRDVILARAGVETSDPKVALFENKLVLPLAGSETMNVTFSRGYSSVTASKDGASFVFANSHLEIGALEPIQIKQAEEVLAALPASLGPMLLVGDFNSPPRPGTRNSYALLREAFGDAYPAVRGEDPGFTCCQSGDLKNPASEAHDRIDLVLYRSFRPEAAAVIGADPATGRTPGGVWASDHLGVSATLTLGN
jgi:endonuclease/exonuclease/phosphatase family metal-dependent hydrolase